MFFNIVPSVSTITLPLQIYQHWFPFSICHLFRANCKRIRVARLLLPTSIHSFVYFTQLVLQVATLVFVQRTMPRILNAALWPIIFFAMAMNSHSLFRKCFCFLWVSLCAACTWHSLCTLFLRFFPSLFPFFLLSFSPASQHLCLLRFCT